MNHILLKKQNAHEYVYTSHNSLLGVMVMIMLMLRMML